MFYTTAWCTGDEESFRRAIPLEALGASMRYHGSTIPFTIVLLEGVHLLSPAYLQMLESLGFTLVDYSNEFQIIVDEYCAIDKRYGHYERNCLLRWIAIKQLSAGEAPFSQCWHLDSDVLLHTSLDELAADTAGKTFMLQGCPVLVSIADPCWFDQYEDNLKALNEDITGFSARASAEKDQCLQNDLLLANQSLFANPFVHDQDLLEYLVSAQKILQAPATTIFDSRYYFIQNPLSLHHWHAAQYQPAVPGLSSHTPPHFSIDEKLHIRIGAKQVPFTHFQNTFALYAGVYLTLRQLHFPAAFSRRILRYSIYDEEFRTGFLFKVIAKINSRRPFFSRRVSIIREMMRSTPPSLLSVLDLLLQQESQH
jgi:hypothetical protein